VFEQHLVGLLGEVAVPEDDPRLDLGEPLGGLPSRPRGVTQVDHVVPRQPEPPLGRLDGGLGELLDRLDGDESRLLLGDVGEVRVVEPPERFQPLELTLQFLVPFVGLLEFAFEPIGLAFEPGDLPAFAGLAALLAPGLR
jgi:hypothetical protein